MDGMGWREWTQGVEEKGDGVEEKGDGVEGWTQGLEEKGDGVEGWRGAQLPLTLRRWAREVVRPCCSWLMTRSSRSTEATLAALAALMSLENLRRSRVPSPARRKGGKWWKGQKGRFGVRQWGEW